MNITTDILCYVNQRPPRAQQYFQMSMKSLDLAAGDDTMITDEAARPAKW